MAEEIEISSVYPEGLHDTAYVCLLVLILLFRREGFLLSFLGAVKFSKLLNTDFKKRICSVKQD